MALYDIVKQDVLDHAAELSEVEDAAWARILAYVNRFDLSWVGEDDDTTTMARIYLAAHIGLTIKPGSSVTAAGPVVSESVGGVRRTYANLATSTTESSLSSTKYGRQYNQILTSSLVNGPFLV
jgi:hypothetical protein